MANLHPNTSKFLRVHGIYTVFTPLLQRQTTPSLPTDKPYEEKATMFPQKLFPQLFFFCFAKAVNTVIESAGLRPRKHTHRRACAMFMETHIKKA